MSSDATPAYRGYRLQALYVLSRILESEDSADLIFQPEGHEDLAIYNNNEVLLEVLLAMLLNPHLPPLLLKQAKVGASKARPRICSMRCWGVLIRCWLCSMTCGFLLPTISPKEIFGWPKFSKRFLALFGVRLGPQLFAISAVIFLPCRSRAIACCPLLLLSFMVNLYRSLGDLSSYLFLLDAVTF
jgi:hypothetical protein